VERFRRLSIWDLRVGDDIKYRAGGQRMRGRVAELARSPGDVSVSGRLITADGTSKPFRLTARDKVSRRLLSFGEIMAELDDPKDDHTPTAW